MTAALLLLAGIGLIVLLWAVARLMRAARLSRRGFDIASEDRRLRDDPRFTEIWVQQFKKETPPDSPAAPRDVPPSV